MHYIGNTITTREFSSPTAGRMAIATGIAGLLALALLILFFTVGGPFGTLNDICNGLTGILSGVLAWMQYTKFHRQLPFLSYSIVLPLIGALAVALGSVLVIFEITGWILAGLYTSAGYALIGVWLAALNYSVRQINPWPHRLVNFGLIIGIIMALGLLTIPRIVNMIDAWELGPWYINYVGQAGSSIGYLLLYPIWCILIGRNLIPAKNIARI